MDWSCYYPAFVAGPDESQNMVQVEANFENGEANSSIKNLTKQLTKNVEVADIGCGFGGLLVALAPVMPNTLLLGMKVY